MKMFEVLELQNLYNSISQVKLPLRTTYKFTKLMKRAAEEAEFFKEKFEEIVAEYGQKDGDHYKVMNDGQSIAIIPGKEAECNQRVLELRNLDVSIEGIKFSIEELENLNVSINELNCLMSLIED